VAWHGGHWSLERSRVACGRLVAVRQGASVTVASRGLGSRSFDGRGRQSRSRVAVGCGFARPAGAVAPRSRERLGRLRLGRTIGGGSQEGRRRSLVAVGGSFG